MIHTTHTHTQNNVASMLKLLAITMSLLHSLQTNERQIQDFDRYWNKSESFDFWLEYLPFFIPLNMLIWFRRFRLHQFHLSSHPVLWSNLTVNVFSERHLTFSTSFWFKLFVVIVVNVRNSFLLPPPWNHSNYYAVLECKLWCFQHEVNAYVS